MAVSANTVWDVDTAGSSNNGGGFVTGASGSFQTTAVNITSVTSSGAGNVCLHASADASWVGNIINVVSGTNFTTTAGAARFEITAVTPGVDFTCSTNISGASISTGIGSNGNMYVGGRVKFYNSATDDTLLENSVAGNKWYIKTGSHSMGAVTTAANGTRALPIHFRGYNATYDDNPSVASGNQPVITTASDWTTGTFWDVAYIELAVSSANGLILGGANKFRHGKIVNSSGTANRAAIVPGDDCSVVGSELRSTNGYAYASGNSGVLIGCYIHDSNVGVRISSTSANIRIVGNIIETITLHGIQIVSGTTTINFIVNNTLYGAASPTGSSVGIDMVTGVQESFIYNNIITGWVTGVACVDSSLAHPMDFNNFYNNTTNRTNVPTGANDIALDPSFVDAPNGNFAPGTNMQRVGFPTSFPGGLSTSYSEIGAVQSNYSSWYTDVDTTKVLTTQGDYKYNSLSNNRTPTATSGGGSHAASQYSWSN